MAIRQKGRDIEVRRADVRALATLRQQLSDLQSARPQLPAELDKERQAAQHRKQLLEAATRGIDDGLQFVEKLQDAIAAESNFGELAELMDQVERSQANSYRWSLRGCNTRKIRSAKSSRTWPSTMRESRLRLYKRNSTAW